MTLDPVLGVLSGYGLLEEIRVPTPATSPQDDPPEARIRRTAFGSELLDRMQVIGEVDTGSPRHGAVSPTVAVGCLICGRPLTRRQTPSVNPLRQDTVESGKVVYEYRPQMPICEKHLEALLSRRLAVG